MKEGPEIKLNRFILTAFLLFLTSFTFPASNRDTCPRFGTKSIDAISHTAMFTSRQSEIQIPIYWQ